MTASPTPPPDNSGDQSPDGRPGGFRARFVAFAVSSLAAMGAVLERIMGNISDGLSLYQSLSVQQWVAVALFVVGAGVLYGQYRRNQLSSLWLPIVGPAGRRWLARLLPVVAFTAAAALIAQPAVAGLLAPGDRVTGTVPVGSKPHQIAILSDTRFPQDKTLYVTNSGAGTLSVITIDQQRFRTDDIGIGNGPDGVLVTSGKVFVSNNHDSGGIVYRTVERIGDEQSPIAGSDFDRPSDMTVNATGDQVFAVRAHNALDQIGVRSGRHFAVTVAESAEITSIAASPTDERALFLTDSPTGREGRLLVLDPVRGIGAEPRAIGLGGLDSRGMAVSPDGRWAVVANHGSRSVSMVDLTGSWRVERRTVGDGPVDVAITHDSRLAYVANQGSNTVSVIDLGSPNLDVAPEQPVGEQPIGLAIDASDTCAYVLHAGTNPNVSALPIRGATACGLTPG